MSRGEKSVAEDTSPELASVIAAAMEARLLDVHISLPGRVESYDASRQVANVKPMLLRVLRQEDMTRVTEELPVIPCVPVQWPRGGGAMITLPLAAGDFGWLMFADYSIDRFRSTGEDVDPGDERRFDLANAVFQPNGPYPSSEPLADASDSEVRIGFDGGYQAAITSSETQLPAGAIEFLCRADRTLSELSAIISTYNTHDHPETGGTTGIPNQLMSAASSPASDTVKGT
jgi:hypothetical protein